MLMLGCKRLSQPELVPISKATKRVVTPPTWTPCPEQDTQSSLSNLSGFLSCAALVTFCFLWRRETLRVKCFTKEHSNLVMYRSWIEPLLLLVYSPLFGITL